MANKPVKVLTDLLTKKQIIKQDLEGNTLFLISGTVDSGFVSSSFPITASYFVGDGRYLTNVSGTVYTSGSISGSGVEANPIFLKDPLIIGTITSSYIYSPEITGNLYGTSSYALNALSASSITISLNDLSDVNTVYAVSGNYLKYDGTNWLPVIFNEVNNIIQPLYHASGTFNGQNTVELQLPTGSGGFPITDLERIIYTLVIKEVESSDWNNDLASVSFKVSSSHIYAVISAPTLPYAYSFNAINQNVSSSYAYTQSTSSFALTASYAENINPFSVQNAYKRLRYQEIGFFDATGSATIELPTASYGGTAFVSSSFDYINVAVQVKEDGRWLNDLLSIQLFTSSNKVFVELSAPALNNTNEYKLLALNEDPDYFIV